MTSVLTATLAAHHAKQRESSGSGHSVAQSAEPVPTAAGHSTAKVVEPVKAQEAQQAQHSAASQSTTSVEIAPGTDVESTPHLEAINMLSGLNLERMTIG